MSILGIENFIFSIPDIDNMSIYHVGKLSICCIDKKFLSIQNKDNLSVCCIDKLYLSGIEEHIFVYIAYIQVVFIYHIDNISIYIMYRKKCPYAI